MPAADDNQMRACVSALKVDRTWRSDVGLKRSLVFAKVRSGHSAEFPAMATQKPGGWVQSLITRFDSQVCRFCAALVSFVAREICWLVAGMRFIHKNSVVIYRGVIVKCLSSSMALRLDELIAPMGELRATRWVLDYTGVGWDGELNVTR